MTLSGPSPPPETSREALLRGLADPAAYPHPVAGPVEVHETHISHVFLAGPYAYKTKKPCVTGFLDYGTLAARQSACEKELRLNRRYAPDLYLAVVPITLAGGQPRVAAPDAAPGAEQASAVEYAVMMHRFPNDALLRARLRRGALTVAEVHQLAETVAVFHSQAAIADPSSAWGSPQQVGSDARANLRDLRSASVDAISASLAHLERWTEDALQANADRFAARVTDGRIRECHGDLHLENVIYWQNRLLPFDGIEFNEGFRWIDVLSDAAFLAMDLAACGRDDLSHSFTSGYLARTGDYGSLELWRWYRVYRALVRGKVAAIRAGQTDLAPAEQAAAAEDCRSHIALAERFTAARTPCLWITHGLSGSGKTTGSERLVQQCGAICIRSDIERNRLFGRAGGERAGRLPQDARYAEENRQRVYDSLAELAAEILRAGYPVVVDATFLQSAQRQSFAELARRCGVRFAILDFEVDAVTLRQRITARRERDADASEATLEVLEQQRATREPLSDGERSSVEELPAAAHPPADQSHE